VHGLLGGPALPIDGGAGYRFGPARGRHGGAGDLERLLADLADAAPGHVVDYGRIDPRPDGERLQDVGGQIGRVDPDRPPFLLPTGVRTAVTMTASFMFVPTLLWLVRRLGRRVTLDAGFQRAEPVDFQAYGVAWLDPAADLDAGPGADRA
jgi:hypothetical protein